MELIINEKDKIVEIWLTKAEKENDNNIAAIKPICSLYKKQKYTVAVYESGESNLLESTTNLLIYNKNLSV